jgi:hypothetical protein
MISSCRLFRLGVRSFYALEMVLSHSLDIVGIDSVECHLVECRKGFLMIEILQKEIERPRSFLGRV